MSATDNTRSACPEYSVGFGQEAWTLVYRDATGECVVTFDCDLDSLEHERSPQKLILNPGIASGGLQPDVTGSSTDREELIMNRKQAHLQSIGYVVERCFAGPS
jgi:hypothetical protein